MEKKQILGGAGGSSLLSKYGIELVLLVMIGVSALIAPSFLKPGNLISVFR
jgi:hypothetical protein